MRHLWRCDAEVWCDADAMRSGPDAHDPYDADCTACLREAATFGARAAMRCAAVEAGVDRDPEIERERDEAVAALDTLRGILGQHELFACAGCSRLFHVQHMGFHAGLMAWCADCSTSRGRIL